MNENKTLKALLSELDEFEKASKRKYRSAPSWALILAILLIAGSVVAATVLLRQSSSPVVTTPNPLTAGVCQSALMTEGTMIIGQSGFIVFACGPSAAAFIVASGGTFTLSVTGFASPWTTVFVITGGATAGATSCAAAYAAHAPSAGLSPSSPSAPVTLTATSYGYCVDYASATASSAPALTFTWSQ